jgi:DNA topoisomerase-1
MELIVVESPTKARTLSGFLGKEYEIEASMGHIKDLPKSKLSVDVDRKFTPTYEIVEKKQESIEKIKKAAKKATKVHLATDPDREGEAIAYHVYEILDLGTKAKRIVFHEITKSAVETAINDSKDINMDLVDAQTARRVLDRLVGYKLSPILWKKVRRGLSAGRVQSVTVRLIVEREREIEAFKAKEYWEIFCEVSKDKKDGKTRFVVKLDKIDGKKASVKDKKSAEGVVDDLKVSDYKIFDVVKRKVSKTPHPPFTTSTITQASSRLFGWSAKRTMGVAQRLYERGLITYHRTDSTNIAKVAVQEVRKFIKDSFGLKYLPDTARFYKTKSKVAQEAHESIRPTNAEIKTDNTKFTKLGNDPKKLYDLIWKRFVACQMSDSVYDETKIDVLAKTKTKKEYLLIARGQVMRFDGWRIVYGKSDETNQNILPDVEKGDLVYLISVDPQQKFTQPPARYRESSLIKTLEKLGIGRPSTYAPTISTIQIRNYVEKKEGSFHPTPVGIAVNDFLIKNFPDVFEYGFTAEMEGGLDEVANGKKKWNLLIGEFWKPFDKKVDQVEKNSKRVKIETEKLGEKCPKCKKGEKVIRIGRFGKFVSCSDFPDCDFTEKYIEKIGMKCPDCKKGEIIIKQTSKRRRFYGCSNYPECKWASWRKPKVAS